MGKQKSDVGEQNQPAAEETPPQDWQARIDALEARIAALESMAHNTHSIPPETIEAIIKQSVQRVGRHLRTTSDILSVLE